MKLKKGDHVLIIAGKDRGRTGKILDVFPKESKIAVEGMNIHTKHTRARRQGQKGQKIEVPARFDSSNAKIICPKCAKAVRVGYKTTPEKKYRICKKCGEEI